MKYILILAGFTNKVLYYQYRLKLTKNPLYDIVLTDFLKGD